jgi:hypothetical protein
MIRRRNFGSSSSGKLNAHNCILRAQIHCSLDENPAFLCSADVQGKGEMNILLLGTVMMKMMIISPFKSQRTSITEIQNATSRAIVDQIRSDEVRWEGNKEAEKKGGGDRGEKQQKRGQSRA